MMKKKMREGVSRIIASVYGLHLDHRAKQEPLYVVTSVQGMKQWTELCLILNRLCLYSHLKECSGQP